jgi:YggT family protein
MIYVSDASTFLVDTLIGLYMLVVLLRFLLQCARADFYNPISQFVVAATNPPLRLLRRFIPGFAGIDVASLVLLVGLGMIKIYLLALLVGAAPRIGGVFTLAVADVARLTLYVYMVAVFIRVILSWVNPGAHHPAVVLLVSLTEPVMAPARRLIPAIGGLDLSPIMVLIAISLLLRLVVQPLLDLGRMLL